EIDTILVLSGISTRESVEDFPFRPDYVFNNVGDIVKE
ncbi:MAG: HAD hydrolase-like protein, partial [Clostridia bacterium]|nr:HAD hydrolase-like protein [Clostridia bacterium]